MGLLFLSCVLQMSFLTWTEVSSLSLSNVMGYCIETNFVIPHSDPRCLRNRLLIPHTYWVFCIYFPLVKLSSLGFCFFLVDSFSWCWLWFPAFLGIFPESSVQFDCTFILCLWIGSSHPDFPTCLFNHLLNQTAHSLSWSSKTNTFLLSNLLIVAKNKEDIISYGIMFVT